MATNIPLTGNFNVTCEYHRVGKTWSAGHHTGIDLTGDDIIYGTCNGIVYKTGFDKSYGNYVVVQNHEKNNFHWFCHLAQIYVKQGASITRTTKIGLMGATGNVTGKHLHYEIRQACNCYDKTENPADYMGIPNKVGSYNTGNYTVDNVENSVDNYIAVGKIMTFAVTTNIREKPTTSSTKHTYKPNTTVEILETNVANSDGYIWDKVVARATGRIGYVARTGERYK